MSKITWIFIFILLFFFLPLKVSAQQVCQQQDPCSNKSLQDQPACYQTVVDACKNQRETLSSQINLMNNQIRLLTLKIENTKAVINKLSGEINELGDEITRLEGILTQRSTLLLRRIPESYKRASTPQFGFLFFSQNLSDFITRAKYLSKVQKEDAEILFQVKATQNNFSERKSLREEKKTQQEKAKKQLEQQNFQLAQQKQEKDALLSATQGNEARYSQLLAQARAQLAAIQNFVTGAGGASILPHQDFCNDWGCYYNQRDANWGQKIIGSSTEIMAEVGCLVTSVSMVLTHYGKSVTPSDVAGTLEAFVPGTAYMWYRAWSVKGATVYRTAVSMSAIDGELAQNRPVIVGVYKGPGHFVVLKGGSNGNYTMNDPFWPNEHDVSFSSRYKISDITEVDTVRIN